MNSELQKAIAELIGTITAGAKSTGTAIQNIAPEAWKVMIYQTQITAVLNIITWTLIAFCLFGFAFFLFGKGIRISKERIHDLEQIITKDSLCNKINKENIHDVKEILWLQQLGFWAFLAVGFGMILISLNFNIPKLINPQYAAGVNLVILSKTK